MTDLPPSAVLPGPPLAPPAIRPAFTAGASTRTAASVDTPLPGVTTPAPTKAAPISAAELALAWGAFVVPLWLLDGDLYAAVAPPDSKPSELALTIASATIATIATAVIGIGSRLGTRKKQRV